MSLSEPNKQISKPRERAISREKHRTGTSQMIGKAEDQSEPLVVKSREPERANKAEKQQIGASQNIEKPISSYS